MKQNLKLAVIMQGFEGLKKIVNADLPIKTSYWLNKMINKITTEVELVNNKRNDLIKKYGEEKDGQIKVKKENMQKYLEEMSSFLNDTEIEIEFTPIKLSWIEDVKLSAIELNFITAFIEDDLAK